jgi:hypothetical protein
MERTMIATGGRYGIFFGVCLLPTVYAVALVVYQHTTNVGIRISTSLSVLTATGIIVTVLKSWTRRRREINEAREVYGIREQAYNGLNSLTEMVQRTGFIALADYIRLTGKKAEVARDDFQAWTHGALLAWPDARETYPLARGCRPGDLRSAIISKNRDLFPFVPQSAPAALSSVTRNRSNDSPVYASGGDSWLVLQAIYDLTDTVRLSSELNERQQQEILKQLGTIGTQVTAAAPNKRLIHEAWKAVSAAATVSGALGLPQQIQVVRQLIMPFLR